MKTICLNSKVDGRQPSLNDRVYSGGGLSMAVTTTTFFMGSILEENDMNGENEKPRLRIRKLTEGECYRLMGFERKDEEACKAAGQSASNIYHQAGDSIVVTVLMGIFGELIGADYGKAIGEHADRLHKEVS